MLAAGLAFSLGKARRLRQIRLMDQTARSNRRRTLPIAQIVGIGMLGWALVPSNPYGYYVLLRFVVCAVSAYFAFRAYELRMVGWTWVLGVVAVVYNPVVRVHLNREIWSIVNVATMVLLGITIWALRGRSTPPA